VVAALGSSLSAARIWGAAEQLREEIGLPLLDRSRYDRRVAAARAALGDDAAFDHAWKEGSALTLEQAIEIALQDPVERP
jgi:non-specific serine/threonine protein kinase